MNNSITDSEKTRLRAKAERARTVFQVCGIVFQKELSEEDYEILVSGEAGFVPRLDDDALLSSGLEALEDWRSWLTEREADREFLREEWFRSFAGVGKPIAPPWGSYYTDKESLLFSEDTMKVRKWYKRYGLEIQQKNNEPDDQIGLLLTFLSHLVQCEIEMIDSENDSAVRLAQREQLQFMEECLFPWIEKWAELLERGSRSKFYIGFERIALGALISRRQTLREALDEQG